jgi:hypothetical protein
MIDMNEVGAATETLARAFEEYKSVNDMRLNEIERKGSVDVIVDEKLGSAWITLLNKFCKTFFRREDALRRPAKGAYSKR